MNTTKPMTSNRFSKNLTNLVKASPRRSFWLALAVVCLSAVVVIPLARTRAAGPAPHARVAPNEAAPQTGSGPQAPSLLNHAATTRASFDPQPFTIGVCDTAGPIEIEASLTGTGPVSYGSLVAAFAAINAGTHTGAISVEVCSNTTEGATAVLNASGTGSASYSVIIMRPAGGEARTISGSIAGPLIDLNGADNVTITGTNGAGDSLTLENSLSATTPSTIRFIGDATGNTVQNATIKGAGTSTTLGTIFFSTGTTTGNDSNIISNNTITSSGSNFPTNAIYSSGTSTAIDNGAIQITNNNIQDYFNAASVTAGINVGATGNSGWTITGNKLFQSATRIYTTTNTHNGIFVGGGQGYTISNNTIGYADSAGTGTTNIVGNSVALTGTFPSSYTITGTANATRYIAINATFTAAGTVSNIQNNTIAGFALYTSSGATTTNGVWCGIQVLSGNANIGTTTGNTIGTATASIYTAATTAGALIAPIYATSANTVTIQNNTIQNLDAMGTTATLSGSVNGINSAGAGNFDISGNTIGNTTNPNIRMGTLQTGANLSNVGTTFGAGTGASIFQGILNSASGTVTIGTVALPNTIRNASANSTSSSARVAGIQTSGGTNTIDSNSIFNLTTPSANTSSSSSPAAVGIHLSISGLTHTITRNTIRDISSTAATAAVYVDGIYIGSTPATTMSKNLIYNLTTTSTSTTSSINGILLFNSSATENIYNNMMRLGVGVGNNPIIRGVYDNTATGSPTNIIHNSIYIDGTQTGNTVNTACIKKDLASTMTITDNILWNNRASTGAPGTGTGRHYGIQMVAAAGNPTSNYNDLYTPNNGGTVGFSSGGQDLVTLANWRTSTIMDQNSQSANPQFIDATNATTPNLHIHPTNQTVIEANGILVGAPTDDFDGQTRSGLTPVDIGADAGNFAGIDLTAPVITYTALGNTTLTTDRTLSITVTDASGVPVSGAGLPVIYYRKNAGSYVNSQCVFVSGSNYNCTMLTASLGGLVSGDTVGYYVMAQDSAATPNVASNPSTGASGFTANPPAASTPTTAPNTYTIATAITGTKTVCASGCDYTTLTGAAGIFNAINTGVATGNINIEINGDLTANETGAVALNALAEEPSGSNFTVKIYPTGGARLITSTTAPTGGFIRLNAADRVTIDGSIGGTGTDRSLTITEANTGTTSAVIWLQSSGADGATNNTIKNLNVVGNSNTTTLIGIGSGNSTVGITSTGTSNNNNTFQNNSVSKTQYGIYSGGASAAAKNTGNAITQNLINTASPNNVQIGGIYVIFESGINISNNNLANIVTSTSVTPAFGISLGLRNSNIFSSFTGSEVVGATVNANIVDNIVRTGDGSAFGIGVAEVTTAASAANTFSNNAVSRVRSTASTPSDFPTGMLMGGGTGSTTRLYFNSVSASGVCSSSSPCFAVVLAGSNPVMDVRNNIFYNIQTSTSGKIYAIGTTSTTFTNLTSNYNEYFTNSANFAVTGGLAGTDRTFATWKSTTGQDANALNSDPLFNSLSNLQPQTGSPVIGAGVFGTGVTTDILGTTRTNPPSIGAYDTALDTAGPVITYTAFGNTTSTVDRTLAITVTDVAGVPTSGAGLPVLYFRKGTSGAYTASTCSFVSGSNYNCTTNYAAVGGVVTTDTIQYYVAAQDNLGNVSTNPSTGAAGFTTNPPAASTPPTTPNSYLIATGYSGSLTVGTGGTFASLTNTGGLFQTLNSGVLTGNVTIEILSNLTGETGTVSLAQQAEEGGGAGTYTVTIKPTGGSWSITSTTGALGVIGLLGADRVTIDGSQSGGTDRSLSIINANTTSSGTSVVAVYSLGVGAGATNNTIKNCVIQNGTKFEATTSSFNFGIYVGGNGVAAGPDNDNLTIQNNLIQRTNTGMQVIGGASPGALDNLVISGNTIGGALTADYIGAIGMSVGNATGASVTQNTVRNHLFTAAGDGAGILVGAGFVSSSITRNTINNLEASNSGGYGMTGIYIQTGNAASSLTVANNFIYDIRGTSWTTSVLGDTVVGIRVAGTGTGGINIWNNSVNLYGSYAGASGSATVTAAFMVNGTTPTALDVRNNIFVNTFDNTAGTGDKSYAIYTSTANSMFTDSNYNDYFVSGTPGVLGAINSTDTTTIALLRTATTKDAQSINSAPLYASNTDLHIASGSPARNTGDTIAGVTNDYDGDTRPQESVYEIGADEYVDSIAPTTTLLTNPPLQTNSNSATFTFSGADSRPRGADKADAANDGSRAPEVLTGFECDLDGGGFTSCSSPKTYNSLADGSHTFQVRAKDAGGNVDPTPESYTWLVDTTPPESTINSGPSNPTNNTTATFGYFGADGGSGLPASPPACTLDSAPVTCQVNYPGLSDGSHTFTVAYTDVVGNTDPTPASYTWVIDATAPTTSITGTPANPTNQTTATFNFTGNDGSGVGGLTFQCQLDGGGYSSCASGINYGSLVEGAHTFDVRALDSLGNTDATPDSFTWTVDLTAPVMSYTPLSNIAAVADRTFTVTASDSVGVSGVNVVWENNGGLNGFIFNPCSLTGGTAQSGTWTCTIQSTVGSPAQTNPGTVSYFVSASDSSSNLVTTPSGATVVPGTPRNMFTVGSGGTIDVTNFNSFVNLVVGNGWTLNGNATVTGTLTLGGILNTGANTLSIACSGSITGANASNYIVGNLQRDICGTTTYQFPVGTPANGSARETNGTERAPEGVVVNEYTPVSIIVNSFTAPASLTVKANDTYLPGLGTSGSLSRHWDVTKTGAGALNVDMTFQYLDEDVYGTEANSKVFRFAGTATQQPGSINAAANTFTATGVTTFSKWGAGLVPTAAGASIGGRVLDANGNGVGGAVVIISGGDLSTPIAIRTGPFGYYSFTGLAVSRVYVVSVTGGRHTFANPTRTIDLSSDITNADFIANP